MNVYEKKMTFFCSLDLIKMIYMGVAEINVVILRETLTYQTTRI